MSNKKIALDLDGVIADIALSIDLELFKRGIEDYDYSDWLTTHHECNLSNSIMANTLFWKNLKPIEDAWYQVNYWFANNYDVYIVTARRTEASIKATQEWLDGWKINTMEPIFCKMGEKHNVVKKLNPIFMVEDNHNEVKTLLGDGINTYLRKAWYNRDHWNKLPSIGTLSELSTDD